MMEEQIDPELLGLVHARRSGGRVFYGMNVLTEREWLAVCWHWDRRHLQLHQWRGEERRRA